VLPVSSWEPRLTPLQDERRRPRRRGVDVDPSLVVQPQGHAGRQLVDPTEKLGHAWVSVRQPAPGPYPAAQGPRRSLALRRPKQHETCHEGVDLAGGAHDGTRLLRWAGTMVACG
jgi:hypothetical protein